MDFELMGSDDKLHKLSDFIDHYLVLYVYPKDMTSGCTTEALEFKELNDEFEKIGARIWGLSKDTVTSHKRFIEKYELPFLLLADPERDFLKSNNLLKAKKMYGKDVMGTIRSTFVFDKNGKLIKEFRDVKPANHAKEVLDFIKSYDDEHRR